MRRWLETKRRFPKMLLRRGIRFAMRSRADDVNLSAPYFEAEDDRLPGRGAQREWERDVGPYLAE